MNLPFPTVENKDIRAEYNNLQKQFAEHQSTIDFNEETVVVVVFYEYDKPYRSHNYFEPSEDLQVYVTGVFVDSPKYGLWELDRKKIDVSSLEQEIYDMLIEENDADNDPSID